MQYVPSNKIPNLLHKKTGLYQAGMLHWLKIRSIFGLQPIAAWTAEARSFFVIKS